MDTNKTGALIVGAGPTGLTLACELARRGAAFRIVSAAEGPSTTVKASELQSRTLEVFEDMGLRERAEELGVRLYGLTMYAEGQRVLHMAYDDLDAPFPYKLVCGQVHTERLLAELLASLGGRVEWGSRVEAVEAADDGAVATVRGPHGTEKIRAGWVIGCDGAHSTVREVCGAKLEGKTYPEEWILGDVKLDWDLAPDEQYAFLSGAGGFTEITCQPLPHNRWQLGGPLPIDPGAPSRNGEQPTLAELQDFFDRNSAIPARLSDPQWLTIYRVHQRAVTQRVHRRLVLAGDAARLSSPVGGVGMNTGIQDAYNLGWKLALVLAGAGEPQLIDTYDAERQAAVRDLFRVSDRQHLLASLRHPIGKELRNHLLSALARFDAVTDRSYRDQSQTKWGYRNSSIVGEESGAPLPRAGLSDHGSQLAAWTSFARGPRAGDRAPDAGEIVDSDGITRRLFEVLAGADHVLLYLLGCELPHPETLATATAIARRIGELDIGPIAVHLVVAADKPPEGLEWDGALIFDPSQALHNRYGARGECLYLIRPDGYIGFRAQPPSLQALVRHLNGIFTAPVKQPARQSGSAHGVACVAGLVAAVGLGVAVATSPGVAYAETSDSGSSSSGSSSSLSSSSSSSRESSSASSSDSSSSVSTSYSVGSASSTKSTSSGGSGPSTVVRSSGGAHTSGTTDEDSAETTADAAIASEGSEPVSETAGESKAEATPSDPTASTTPELVIPTESETAAESDAGVAPQPSGKSDTTTGRRPASDADSGTSLSVSLPPASARLSAANSGDRSTGTAETDSAQRLSTATTATDSTPTALVTDAAPSSASAAQTTEAVVPQTAAAPATAVGFVASVVSSVLGWVGLAPSAASTPVAPAQPAFGLWAVLAWVRREIQHTFFSQAPTIGYNPAENSQTVNGVVAGDLNAVDADGDPLSFTVTEDPENGTAVVNPDGTFTYTPSDELAETGGADEFTVKVVDQGLHLHGLFGFLQPDFGHSATATIELTVEPVNQPPQVGDPAFTDVVDYDTGIVTGTVNVTDPDGDTLTYELTSSPDPTAGAVVVDENTGDWTYTPTPEARLRASNIDATPAERQVSFDVTASDGEETTVVTVTTDIPVISIAVGSFPIGVAFSPDGVHAYVANRDDDTVSVINIVTNTVEANIPVGDAPWAVAVGPSTPNGIRVYVTNRAENTVSVIDTELNAVTDEFTTFGGSPEAVAVSPDGARIYVANFDSDSVSVIDTFDGRVLATLNVVGDGPSAVAVSPDGARIYITNFNSDTVEVIDTDTFFTIAHVDVVTPNGVAVSPDGATVYVTNSFEDEVSVIDTATHTVIATIGVGRFPVGVAVSPDGARVYVTNGGSLDGTMSVIDTATDSVIATIVVGDATTVAVSPDGTHVVVTNFGLDNVSVLTVG